MMKERFCPEMSRPTIGHMNEYGHSVTEMHWVSCDHNCAKLIGDQCAVVIQAQAEALHAACEQALDALIWVTGSADFGPDGVARVGWLGIGAPAIETLQKLLAK